MNKEKLRSYLIKKRKELLPEFVEYASEKVCKKLISYLDKNKIKSVHTYLPIQNEINTIPIIRHCLKNDIMVIVSKTLKNKLLKHMVLNDLDDLVEGRFGIRYPKVEVTYTGHIDLIIVPGVGFDYDCNRLGFGAGYYDIFLSRTKTSTKIAIAHDFQIVEKIDSEPHDIPMDFIFTPSKKINKS